MRESWMFGRQGGWMGRGLIVGFYNQGKCSWIEYGSINFFSSIAAGIEGYRVTAKLADSRWSEV
jgi:hypothetical protein